MPPQVHPYVKATVDRTRSTHKHTNTMVQTCLEGEEHRRELLPALAAAPAAPGPDGVPQALAHSDVCARVELVGSDRRGGRSSSK